MLVAIAIVDAADVRPELVLATPGGGPGSLLSWVRVRPLISGYSAGGVGSVDERVVIGREVPFFDRSDLFADSDHGVAEAIEL